MARLPRANQKVFAADAVNNGQFGSAQLGTKVLSSDIAVLQALPAFLTGWLNAVIGTKKFPPLEEFQAMDYITTRQLAYIFQQGVPEWEVGTTYYQNSIVCKPGTYELYGSLIDDNIGEALPNKVDDTNWKYLQDLAASTPDATDAVKGIAMLATKADIIAANASKIVTPNLLAEYGFRTGDGKESWLSTLQPGWIWADSKTIGDVGSNATNRENADTQALFTALWEDAAYNYVGAVATNPALQVWSSAGVAVAKGASALADWNAKRTISVIDKRGLVSAGRDNMGGVAAGRLTGQDFGLNGQILGLIGGQESHSQTALEVGPHTHPMKRYVVSFQSNGPVWVPDNAAATPPLIQGATNPNTPDDAGAPMNVVQPTTVCNYVLKL